MYTIEVKLRIMCLEYYTHSLNACDSSKTLMCLEYYTIEGKLLMCLEYYTIEVKLLCKNKLGIIQVNIKY